MPHSGIQAWLDTTGKLGLHSRDRTGLMLPKEAASNLFFVIFAIFVVTISPELKCDT